MLIKVKFQPSAADPTTGTIIYHVTHNQKSRKLPTGYLLRSDEWNPRTSVPISAPDTPRQPYLLAVRDAIHIDVARLNKIAAHLSQCCISFTTDDVIDEYKLYRARYSLTGSTRAVITALRQKGCIATAAHYGSALRSFLLFLSEEHPHGSELTPGDLMLHSLTSDIMELYQAWLKGRGLCSNTISFYNRIIRAVYRRAVDDGVIDDLRPFRHVYTGVDKTVKRAMPLATISKIRSLDLSLNPSLDLARDMFILSFYLRGMSFVDMAYLRKTDLRDGCLTYRRRKTGQQLRIMWTGEMQAILDKYPDNDTDYLLPIIRKSDTNEHYAYRNASSRLNIQLKKIGSLVGATDSHSWSFYRARHSWASAAYAKGVPINVISEGMGHDSETTTQIYLAQLDTTVVDRANALIISSLSSE